MDVRAADVALVLRGGRRPGGAGAHDVPLPAGALSGDPRGPTCARQPGGLTRSPLLEPDTAGVSGHGSNRVSRRYGFCFRVQGIEDACRVVPVPANSGVPVRGRSRSRSQHCITVTLDHHMKTSDMVCRYDPVLACRSDLDLDLACRSRLRGV